MLRQSHTGPSLVAQLASNILRYLQPGGKNWSQTKSAGKSYTSGIEKRNTRLKASSGFQAYLGRKCFSTLIYEQLWDPNYGRLKQKSATCTSTTRDDHLTANTKPIHPFLARSISILCVLFCINPAFLLLRFRIIRDRWFLNQLDQLFTILKF